MTVRALFIGVVVAVLLAGFGYYNDSVLSLTMIVGNHLPISVFGLLILAVMLVGPLLYLIHRRLRARPAELAVIVTLMLVACAIPGSGLMRTFLCSLAMPVQYNEGTTAWKQTNVLGYAPDAMLPEYGRELRARAERTADPEQKKKLLEDAAQLKKEVIDDFIDGKKDRRREFALWEAFEPDPVTKMTDSNVPWSGWAKPLKVWLPLIVLTAVCVICMSLIVHRQWASRERLRYPIVELTNALIAQEEGKATPPVLRNRLFWVGFAVVFCIHVVNGIATMYPDDMNKIPLTFPMSQIGQAWPKLAKASMAWRLLSPTLWPTVVAFAFFLASDVSFSLGMTQVISVPMLAALTIAGIDVSFDYMEGGPPSWQLFGSFLGIGVMLAYMGRRHYWNVLKQALTFRRQEGVGRYAGWACRIFLLAAVGFILVVALPQFGIGLDWPFAVLFFFLIMLMFLVMARINAESGLFFIQPYWQPLGVMLGLFGAAALGPGAIVILGLLCAVLTIDPRETLMPFVVNGLKICDDQKVRPGRVGLAAGGTYLAGLALAVLVVFWASYNYGAPRQDGWAYKSVPVMPFKAGSKHIAQLEYSGQLDAARDKGPIERVTTMGPNPKFLWAVGIGVALVLVCSILRLRYTWWPIHPVIFLVWMTFPLSHFSHSFLLGWLIKAGVTKFGGGRAYRRAIPLMIGIIAGDLLGGLVFMAYGAAYYFTTGTLLDKVYKIFPG